MYEYIYRSERYSKVWFSSPFECFDWILDSLYKIKTFNASLKQFSSSLAANIAALNARPCNCEVTYPCKVHNINYRCIIITNTILKTNLYHTMHVVFHQFEGSGCVCSASANLAGILFCFKLSMGFQFVALKSLYRIKLFNHDTHFII